MSELSTAPHVLGTTISAADSARYAADGYAILPDYFSPAEVACLKAEVGTLMTQDVPSRVMERDGTVVRALHGCHLVSEVLQRLTLLPRMLGAAEQLLGERVYVYQFKVNFKAGFGGDVWQWHQDYIFWRNEDGMRTPRVVNIAIFLDEVSEFNGPVMLIPKSHHHGTIDVAARASAADGSWIENVSAALKYSLDRETIARLVEANGIVAPKGAPGSVLLFHPNIAHASVPNLSPFDRTMLLVTYNSVDNIPVSDKPLRPEFLVGRDTRALTPLPHDVLVP